MRSTRRSPVSLSSSYFTFEPFGISMKALNASSIGSSHGMSCQGWVISELSLLGRSLERKRRRLPAGDDLGDLIEVARPDLALVARGGVAVALGVELGLLELGVRRHAVILVLPGELV